MIRLKAAPTRLDPLSYDGLRQQILRRDGWTCQSCGTISNISNLEVYHMEFRSHSGADSDENLITLCAAVVLTARGCYDLLHEVIGCHARLQRALDAANNDRESSRRADGD